MMQELTQSTHGLKPQTLARLVPRREIVFLEYVEMEKRGGQAHRDVHGRHLILLYGGRDVAEETQQGLQHLAIFIRHQHDGCLDSLQALLLRHVCT